MLKTKVILSNVTNLSDARYASGMGVDYIGFNIYTKSDDFVTAEQMKMITDWLSGVKIIADIENEGAHTSDGYSADFFQTNSQDILKTLDKAILSLDYNAEAKENMKMILDQNKDETEFFLLKVKEHDLANSKEDLSSLCNNYKIYISTNYSHENLSLVLEEIKPEGIIIYGSKEQQTGLSSYDGIADILEQLELD